MTFLAPIVGIVAGAIAIPGLLAMYFLRLRRRPVRISSTLLWREAVQDLQVNAPFRMIRPSWLLLVQLLALLCFVIASARPAVSLAGGAEERIILLIDRSASMRATDAPGEYETRLDEAKARATEIAERAAGSGAEVMVVTYGASARTVSSFTSDAGRLRNAIESIEPSDQPGDLLGALRVVEAFTVNPREDEEWSPARVVLLSDGSIGPSEDGTPVTLGRASAEFVRVGPDPESARENVGIVAYSARRDFEDPAIVRLFARFQSTISRETPVGVTLTIDGETVESRVVRMSGASGELPGEATALFELRRSEGGVLGLRLGREDDLASDDEAWLALRTHGSRRILCVQGPSARAGDGGAALIDALRTLDAGEVQVLSIGEYEQESTRRDFFAGVDLVVFDRSRPSELPPTPTMSMGSGLPIPGLSLEQMEGTREVAFWTRSHPVIRPADLGSVLVSDAYAIEPAVRGTQVGGVTIQSDTLASTRGGPLIVLLEQGALRRLVFGIDLDLTNWWRDRSFPVVIANSVDYLTLAGEGEAGRMWRTGESIVFRAPADAGSVLVSGPEGFRRDVTVTADGSAPLGLVREAGVYRVIDDGGTEDLLCVNLLDPVESAIATRDDLEIGGRSLEAMESDELAPREVWHWFVAAGLVLLLIEWLLFSAKVRV